MAFNRSNWSRQSVALNTGETTVDATVIGGPAVFSYRSATDAIAAISGANYFANAVYDLSVDDIILAIGSDANAMLTVAAVDRAAGTITTATF